MKYNGSRTWSGLRDTCSHPIQSAINECISRESTITGPLVPAVGSRALAPRGSLAVQSPEWHSAAREPARSGSWSLPGGSDVDSGSRVPDGCSGPLRSCPTSPGVPGQSSCRLLRPTREVGVALALARDLGAEVTMASWASIWRRTNVAKALCTGLVESW